jgi:hypothetical protein
MADTAGGKGGIGGATHAGKGGRVSQGKLSGVGRGTRHANHILIGKYCGYYSKVSRIWTLRAHLNMVLFSKI